MVLLGKSSSYVSAVTGRYFEPWKRIYALSVLQLATRVKSVVDFFFLGEGGQQGCMGGGGGAIVA